MSKLEDAIKRLTPEQRALLEKRLKAKRGASPAAPSNPAALQPRSDRKAFPLSPGQERLLMLIELAGSTGGRYNITEAIQLQGLLDSQALEGSLKQVIDRHDVLRASFVQNGNAYVQKVSGNSTFELKRVNLSEIQTSRQLRRVLTLAKGEAEHAFNLENPPLVRAVLVRLAPDNHILIVTLHHLVCDAWSFSLFLKEVAEVYSAHLDGGTPSLPSLSLQFADFAQWQREWLTTPQAEDQQSFWAKQFEGFDAPLRLPGTPAQPEQITGHGASISFPIPNELIDSLKSISHRERLTPFSLFFAAFKALLYATTGQEKQIVCYPTAGRRFVELEPIIGYFNNLLPSTTTLSGNPSLIGLASRIMDQALAAGDHQDIPFHHIADLPGIRRVPLTKAFFTYQEELTNGLSFAGLNLKALPLPVASADFDLSVYIEQGEAHQSVILEYKTDLLSEEQANQLMMHYMSIIEQMAREPETRLSDLPNVRIGDQGAVDEIVVDPIQTPGYHAPAQSVQEAEPVEKPEPKALQTEAEDVPETSEPISAPIAESETPSSPSDEPEIEIEVEDVTSQAEEPESTESPAAESNDQAPTGYITVALPPEAMPSGDSIPDSVAPAAPRQTPGMEARAKRGAPRDSLEGTLVNIWKEVLDLPTVGIHDNFFELGGHSLLAVNLFSRIREQTEDVVLPLATLLEAPTIAQLAEKIREAEKSDVWSPLVMIQQGRTAFPMFCVHGAGGNVLLYRDLAMHMGPDQTVYGLQCAGLDGKQDPLETVEEMAELYVREIQKIQPEGPYVLLGYCLGGTIALEMAQQLRQQGKEVSILAMLETYNWFNAPHETSFMKFRFYIQKLRFHLKNYFSLPRDERRLFWDEKKAELRRRRKLWRASFRTKLGFKPKDADQPSADQQTLAAIWELNDEASVNYEPRPYAGSAIHFRPKEDYSLHRREDLGWDDLIDRLETKVLPVYPGGMLMPPFVKYLAQSLRERIYQIALRDDANKQNGQNGQAKDEPAEIKP